MAKKKGAKIPNPDIAEGKAKAKAAKKETEVSNIVRDYATKKIAKAVAPLIKTTEPEPQEELTDEQKAAKLEAEKKNIVSTPPNASGTFGSLGEKSTVPRKPAKLDEKSAAADLADVAEGRAAEQAAAALEVTEARPGEELPTEVQNRNAVNIAESKKIAKKRAEDAAAKKAEVMSAPAAPTVDLDTAAYEEVPAGPTRPGNAPRLSTSTTFTGPDTANRGLSEGQEAAAAQATQERQAAFDLVDPWRRENALAAFGGEGIELSGGERAVTDSPEIMGAARALAIQSHKAKYQELLNQAADAGKKKYIFKQQDFQRKAKLHGPEPKPEDLTDLALQGSEHQRHARILAYTGISYSDLQHYLGTNEKERIARGNDLHERVMQDQRSRNRIDVVEPRGGQASMFKNPDGSWREDVMWRHPDVTQEDGSLHPDSGKLFKVSEQHPTMLNELADSEWGGKRTEQPFEGFAVLKETPALPDSVPASQRFRYSAENMAKMGDYRPVTGHFGHVLVKGDETRPSYIKFVKPPQGYLEGNPKGLTSAVGALVENAKAGGTATRGPLKRSNAGTAAAELVANAGGTRRIPFSSPSDNPNFRVGQEVITQNGLDTPMTLDEHGNRVAVPPRSGKAGTGQTYLSRQTSDLTPLFRSPAEASAEAMEAQGTEDAQGASQQIEVNKALGDSSLNKSRIGGGNRRRGTTSMLPPQFAKQEVLPGFEHWGGVSEHVDSMGALEITRPSGERATIPAVPAETRSTGLPDSRVLRQQAEAQMSQHYGTEENTAEAATPSEWSQPQIDFNAGAPEGSPSRAQVSRQWLGGNYDTPNSSRTSELQRVSQQGNPPSQGPALTGRRKPHLVNLPNPFDIAQEGKEPLPTQQPSGIATSELAVDAGTPSSKAKGKLTRAKTKKIKAAGGTPKRTKKTGTPATKLATMPNFRMGGVDVSSTSTRKTGAGRTAEFGSGFSVHNGEEQEE